MDVTMRNTFHSLLCKYIGSIWSINSLAHTIQFIESLGCFILYL